MKEAFFHAKKKKTLSLSHFLLDTCGPPPSAAARSSSPADSTSDQAWAVRARTASICRAASSRFSAALPSAAARAAALEGITPPSWADGGAAAISLAARAVERSDSVALCAMDAKGLVRAAGPDGAAGALPPPPPFFH